MRLEEVDGRDLARVAAGGKDGYSLGGMLIFPF